MARMTVHNYFDIMVDTLLGFWLAPWKLKRPTKQVSHPKFYLFDTGVARALSGRLPYPPTSEEMGVLLETFITNEVKAYLSYSGLRYELNFWRNYDGTEVDLLCEAADGFVAVEIKASSQWQPRFSRGLSRLKEELKPRPVRTYGVYLGARRCVLNAVDVLPAGDFLKDLWEGELIN